MTMKVIKKSQEAQARSGATYHMKRQEVYMQIQFWTKQHWFACKIVLERFLGFLNNNAMSIKSEMINIRFDSKFHAQSIKIDVKQKFFNLYETLKVWCHILSSFNYTLKTGCKILSEARSLFELPLDKKVS